MSPRHEEVFDLCAGYLLGSLNEGERSSLEAHLAEGCSQCEAELRRLSVGASLLAASAPPLRAPAALRDRVLTAVRAEPNASSPAGAGRRRDARASLPLTQPARRRASTATWAWATAATVIAIAGAFQWVTTARLELNLAETRGRLAQLRQQLEEEQRWAALPDDPQALVVRLEPTPDGSPLLNGRVVYDPTTRRAVVAFSNFTAPAGKDYQLWAISKTGPLSLGLVRSDATGRAILRLPDVGDPTTLTAFAVSLEQKGGAPTPYAPAGAVVMLGKIGS
jgi:anti-sigma-K factor RskA